MPVLQGKAERKINRTQIYLRKYIFMLLLKNKNTYDKAMDTLCLRCDRTGCIAHLDPYTEARLPAPCEWLQNRARLPQGAEYAATVTNSGEIRIKILSCPKFTDKIGW